MTQLAGIEQPQDAAHIAGKLCVARAVPHLVGGHELHVILRIGNSVSADDGIDVATAMFHAKARGRGNYQFLRADMNSRAVHRQ